MIRTGHKTTSPAQVATAIQKAGLTNGLVCLHSSLKSFGHLEGGAGTVVQAFLQAGCTLLVPTFTYECEVPAPPGRQIARNGQGPSGSLDPGQARPFDPHSAMISPEMGAIPARVLEAEGARRSTHPLNSFAALGPLADEIIATQGPLNVYGPLKALYTRENAHVVLMGVGLTSATPVHLAEEKSGRRLFRRWALTGNGQVQEVEVGSCSDGFDNLQPFLGGIERIVRAGESTWKIYPFQPFIDLLAEAIVRDPAITRCADRDCPRCNDAVRGGPLL